MRPSASIANTTHAVLQGWPIFEQRWTRLIESCSNSELQSLAGNAFPGTVIASLVGSLVFAIDWAEEGADSFTDRNAVQSAMDLLDACR
jgi:hypothetical protein